MDFSDNRHTVAELAFQGATEVDPEHICKADVIDAMATWRHRPNHHLSGADLLQVEDCAVFSISYDGEAGEYWPTESDNDTGETLVREFLYGDGICSLTDERIRLFRIKYRIMAMDGDEYLLVCPYLTEAGNISGIVVVCVTKMLQDRK